MSNYPNNKDSFSKFASKPDAIGQFVTEVLQEAIMVGSIGFWHLLKSIFSKRGIITIPLISGIGWVSYRIGSKAQHLVYLYELEPRLFTASRVNWLWTFPMMYHVGILFALFAFPVVIVMGIWARSIRTKFKRIFKNARLVNGLGDTPKLIRERRIDKERRLYLFDANGIGISEFEGKKEQIESHFRSNVETIKYGAHKGQIAVTFSKQIFPEKLHFNELVTMKVLPKESFYIGISVEGVKTQEIAALPHMLIAGTTGGGKSVFFKQCLLGLLESSPHLQMYLIDLKSGLEMIDFKKAPNVQVIKHIDQAVLVLGLVEREMKDRFAYLEMVNRKQIVPEIDNKDRVIIGVDEASVLYMNRSRHDPDYEAALEARRLADSISKLSRAAAIHLLLATQKLDRQVIPTSVSENISGRMAFRANSLQGSLIVLGTKDACELPEIPGRGIWSFGTRKVIVQAPFVDEKTVKSRCQGIEDMFKTGKRKILGKMLGDAQWEATSQKQDDTYVVVEGKNDLQA
ncbi:MAG: hypothetical protein HYW48_11980 [Deltaproteobacteria bacterium]|nr:hypothetical protein [Deltaproteobacteria bacterium]